MVYYASTYIETRHDDTNHCTTCKGLGMVRCQANQHMTRTNEYGDCFWCDGDTPDLVMCPCQPE